MGDLIFRRDITDRSFFEKVECCLVFIAAVIFSIGVLAALVALGIWAWKFIS